MCSTTKICSCAAASQWGFAAQLDLDVDGAVEIAAGYAGAIVVAALKVRAAAEPGVWITNSLTSKMIILFLPQSVSA